MERRKEVIEVEAVSGNLDRVTGFVEEQVLQMGCPPKLAMQIILAVEEAFVNVVDYAYAPEIGMCRIAVETVQLDEGRGDAVITFIDSGKAFNPLLKENPDITLSADERQIGGLGIYMVKEIMDSVVYEYKDAENHLTMVKSW